MEAGAVRRDPPDAVARFDVVEPEEDVMPVRRPREVVVDRRNGIFWIRDVVLLSAASTAGPPDIQYNPIDRSLSVNAAGVTITDTSVAHVETLLNDGKSQGTVETAKSNKRLRDAAIDVGLLTKAEGLSIVHGVEGTVERKVAGVTFTYTAGVGKEIRLAPEAVKDLGIAASLAALAAAAKRLLAPAPAGAGGRSLGPYPSSTATTVRI